MTLPGLTDPRSIALLMNPGVLLAILVGAAASAVVSATETKKVRSVFIG